MGFVFCILSSFPLSITRSSLASRWGSGPDPRDRSKVHVQKEDPDDPIKEVVQQTNPGPGTVLIPGPTASEEELAEFRRKVTEEGLRPVHPLASRNFPATPVFWVDCEGLSTPMHAALNEVYVPREDGPHEIFEIMPARDLRDWQSQAAGISPEAELLLYFPDQPREEGYFRALGKTLLVLASTPDEAEVFARAKGWEVVENLGSGQGRLLVALANPMAALEVLRKNPNTGSVQVVGNFRRSAFPSQAQPRPISNEPIRIPVGGGGPPPPTGTINKRFTPSDPLFAAQWHLRNTNQVAAGGQGIDLNAPDVWDNYQGTGVLVGVVDDGLQITHPDLSPNVATNRGLHANWAGGATNDPTPLRTGDNHGTPMAGLVAARGNNTLGVSGVAPRATLVGLRLISGPVTDANEIRAHLHALDRIAVKNNSWSRDTDTGVFTTRLTAGVTSAIKEAVTRGRNGLGTVFVWAAGNGAENYRTGSFAGPRFSQDVSNYDGYANNINVIAVGALDPTGVKSWYTERGANVAVSAPSSRFIGLGDADLGLVSTDLAGAAGLDPTDYTVSVRTGGTSAAAAQVSGVVALMLESNPDLGWRDVKEILMRSAKAIDNGDTEWIKNAAGLSFNPLYGAGLVSAFDAVELAKSWSPLSTSLRSATRSLTGLRLAPVDNDPAGVTRTFTFTESFRMESLTLTWSGSGFTIHDLVFYITSPSGTTVRLNAVREDDYSTNLIRDLTFSTPYFWGESSAGTWTLKIVDEYLGGNCLVSALAMTLHGSVSPLAPANDNFDRAQLVLKPTLSLPSLTNVGASREDREPRHAGVTGGGSLWWNYLPPVSGYVTITTEGSSMDTTLAAYRGDSLAGLEEVASNDNAATNRTFSRLGPLGVEAGESLKVVVEGKGSRTRGNFSLRFTHEAAALYDRFAGPKIVKGSSWADARSTRGSPAYGSEPLEPAHAGTLSRSVWYSWTPGVSGTATVTTAGSAIDTVLAVYRGNSLTSLVPIAQNDNATAALRSSRVSFGVVPGETYRVAVDGKTAGSFSVSGSVAIAPGGSGQTAPTPPPSAPTNNMFSTPQAIAGAPLKITGLNRSASEQTGEPNASGQSTSVWYLWTAPRSGWVTVTTKDSLFDTTLGAYRGSSLTALRTIGFNDNAIAGQRWSRLRFQVDAGSSYYLRIDGVRGATGRFYLNVFY